MLSSFAMASPAFFSVLALASFHTRSRVWLRGVVTEKSSCHLSGRLLLFAEKGKEMVQTGSEALICCWQTVNLGHSPLRPDIWLSPPWHCSVCSHRKLLLNSLRLWLSLRTVYQLYLSIVHHYKCSLFPLQFNKDLFEAIMIPFCSSTSMEQLACTWSIDISRRRGHSNFHVFCYPEIISDFNIKRLPSVFTLHLFRHTCHDL